MEICNFRIENSTTVTSKTYYFSSPIYRKYSYPLWRKTDSEPCKILLLQDIFQNSAIQTTDDIVLVYCENFT